MRTVELYENTVKKKDEPSLLRIEVEKARQGYKIAKNTGLFCTPKVIDYDEVSGIVIFERLRGLQMMKDILAFSPTMELVSRIGKVLAEIHSNLILPDEMRKPLPDEFQAPGDSQVFIHGDFNVENVLFMGQYDTIAVIDWQMTSVHGGEATWGTRFFDIAWFINTLFYRPIYRYIGALHEAPWAQIFLRSYSEASKEAINEDQFRSYMERFFRLKMAQRRSSLNPLQRMSLVPANSRFFRFIKSFKLQ
ncbi:MAG: phosphotransferase [Proteobacteria bacterium]|nr:phosphotransferase [Pseudomonadota bacterium]